MDEISEARAAELFDAFYATHRAKLEKEARGKIVLLELRSGDHYIGETVLIAWQQAHTAHPDGQFFSRRIGELDEIGPEPDAGGAA